ncbi:hypothetical protein [Derxia lacustris]|uniref:hypothetical protein n=1 Tax=Derxia lacustris TaxID=764842 RepID=UPI000A177062|nr:hypothetical protein [Derxia lacustris]
MNASHPLLAQPAPLLGWRAALLDEPPAPALVAALPEALKAAAQDFLARADRHPSAAEQAGLDRWYAGADGQQTLAAITTALWTQMRSHAPHAMPAHDARHAMLKVPTAALEHMAAERVTGHARVGVLAALLHDHGRWAEERLFGGPGASLLHARMSLLLGRELLAGFALPPLLAEQILLAALRHTSGAEPADPMPLKLTVAADRDQLWGHEIALRLCHHAPNARGEYASLDRERPGAPAGLSVLDRLEFFLRNRLPGPLFALDARAQASRHWLLDFVLMADSRAGGIARFADLAGAVLPGRRALPDGLVGPDGLEARLDRIEAERPAAGAPEPALAALLALPGVAPSPHYRALAGARLARLDDASRARFASAFVWAERACRQDDARQRAFLTGLLQTGAGDAPVATLAGLLLRDWDVIGAG